MNIDNRAFDSIESRALRDLAASLNHNLEPAECTKDRLALIAEIKTLRLEKASVTARFRATVQPSQRVRGAE